MIIRQATLADAPAMPEVERSAAAAFRALPDLAWVADDTVTSENQHKDLIQNGLSLVAVLPADALCGFVCGLPRGDALHIFELAVAEAHQRKGVGRKLMNAALGWARQKEFVAVTLITFRDVAWNAPFYRSLGFEDIEPNQLEPYLRRLMAHEVEIGLPGERRCAMRLKF